LGHTKIYILLKPEVHHCNTIYNVHILKIIIKICIMVVETSTPSISKYMMKICLDSHVTIH